MNSIQDLKKLEARLASDLSEVREQINKLLCKEFLDSSQFKIGDKVIHNGSVNEITSVRAKYGYVRFYGRKVLKNGGLHANETELYNIISAEK